LASPSSPSTVPGIGQGRVRLLSEVASALSAAASVEAVMRALAGAFVPAVCDGFEVSLRAPDGSLRRIVMGLDEISGWMDRESVPVPELAYHPVRVALSTGETQVISLDYPEHEALFGALEDPTSSRALGVTRAIVAPMAGRSTMKGAVAAGLGPSGRDWSEDDVELISSIARLAGLALENLEALDQQARTAAMLDRAAAVGFAMATLSTEAEIAAAAVSLAREELGAVTGFVYLIDADGLLRLAAYSGYDESVLAKWQRIEADADVPAAEVCRLRQPIVLATRDEIAARYPQLGADTLYSEHALLAAPILVGQEAVGAVYWGWDEAHRLGPAESRFGEVVAEQCAAGVIRARAEAARAVATAQLKLQADELGSIAATLQTSMLPARLPEIGWVEVAANHWPGGIGVQVSGDFYDVLPLREGRWGILIGDVCGKGVEAAVVSSLARHTARAAALHIDDPAAVLRWVHDAVASEQEGRHCTVAYGVLERSAEGGRGAASLALALGGHPLPIRVSSAGAERVGMPGSLLGAFEPTVHRTDVELDEGDLLAFYTDGVTDAPHGQCLEEDEFMELLVRNRLAPLGEIGSSVRAALDERRGPVAYDDTALLLLRIGARAGD
jgi:serine phosphatase RsbU (regulator of sigma subunit)